MLLSAVAAISAPAGAVDGTKDAGKNKPNATQPAGRVDPRTATLADAVGDWVGLLELDFPDAPATAARRWARDDEAGRDLRRLWPDLADRHARYDYRTWITGAGRPAAATAVGDSTTFAVGGHDYGHLHTEWVKTDVGWRIARVYFCR